MSLLEPPRYSDDWIALTDRPLPLGPAAEWAVKASCGALVTFSGTSRDHSGDPGGADERVGVTVLEYEAYVDHVVPRLEAVAAEARRRWPAIGRLVLLHRTGEVTVGETSVLVVASAPHRAEAFAAARFGIDTIKATVPIWKKEVWDGGAEWALDAHPIDEITGAADAAATARPPAPGADVQDPSPGRVVAAPVEP